MLCDSLFIFNQIVYKVLKLAQKEKLKQSFKGEKLRTKNSPFSTAHLLEIIVTSFRLITYI